jgi:hypothetical protein
MNIEKELVEMLNMVVRDNHTWDNRAKQLVDIVSNKLDFK